MVGILVYVIDIQLDANFYMISKFVDKKIAKSNWKNIVTLLAKEKR